MSQNLKKVKGKLTFFITPNRFGVNMKQTEGGIRNNKFLVKCEICERVLTINANPELDSRLICIKDFGKLKLLNGWFEE